MTQCMSRGHHSQECGESYCPKPSPGNEGQAPNGHGDLSGQNSMCLLSHAMSSSCPASLPCSSRLTAVLQASLDIWGQFSSTPGHFLLFPRCLHLCPAPLHPQVLAPLSLPKTTFPISFPESCHTHTILHLLSVYFLPHR